MKISQRIIKLLVTALAAVAVFVSLTKPASAQTCTGGPALQGTCGAGYVCSAAANGFCSLPCTGGPGLQGNCLAGSLCSAATNGSCLAGCNGGPDALGTCPAGKICSAASNGSCIVSKSLVIRATGTPSGGNFTIELHKETGAGSQLVDCANTTPVSSPGGSLIATSGLLTALSSPAFGVPGYACKIQLGHVICTGLGDYQICVKDGATTPSVQVTGSVGVPTVCSGTTAAGVLFRQIHKIKPGGPITSGEPVCVAAPPGDSAPVPALPPWGFATLAVVLGASALLMFKRRSSSVPS